MPGKPKNPSKFWKELKRRKVIRVIIAYAAAGFAIVELVDIISEPLSLPEWALTLVIILVAVGFPIAIIFAWAYDITPSGIEKTEPIDKSLLHTEPLDEKSIIVLPLEDISPEQDNVYFADGLTEEITADLSQINELLVISRSSAMTFKGTKKKIKEIARDVNVRYVLEGSVRKAENKLRITAQLIDAKSDTHIWANKYDGILDDVFSIQEKVSMDIVASLRLKLTNDENNKITSRQIDNFEAYDFYLRATQEVWKFNVEALRQALKFLHKAAVLVGDNHLLYSAMAFIYGQLASIGKEGEDYPAKSKEFAEKALALNPDSATAYHVKGFNALRIHGDPHKANDYLKHALAIEPNLLPSIYSLIALYSYCGKIQAATPLVEQLTRIDPLSFQRYYFEGSLYFFDGKYEAAIHPYRKMHELDPQNSINWIYAWALATCNKNKEAISVIDSIEAFDAKNETLDYAQIIKYNILEDKVKVLKLMTPKSRKICRNIETASYFFSGMLASLGEKEEALDFLSNAIDRGFINYPLMAEKDPFLQNIRREPEFKKLMIRVRHKWENFDV